MGMFTLPQGSQVNPFEPRAEDLVRGAWKAVETWVGSKLEARRTEVVCVERGAAHPLWGEQGISYRKLHIQPPLPAWVIREQESLPALGL